MVKLSKPKEHVRSHNNFIIGIYLQFKNYRKPFVQRLIVRIQLIVPLFAITCYISLRWFPLSKFVEPFKEIYEAFVIYTFFSLLTHLLGGERRLVVLTSGRLPVSQPWPFSLILPAVDISDPFTLLTIKRGILQYVWLKPLICALTAITEAFNLYNSGSNGYFNPYFIINFIYNVSVSVSLYDLALFWKCLYGDLRPFNPWGKFLCVKLIIFASYWQGVLLGLLSWFGVLRNENSDSNNTLGFAIQNALLCIELIGFAIGHWYSFSYAEYNARTLPGCARLTVGAAIRDAFGIGDLVYDFKTTFSGDSYDYRQFDSVEALIAHPASSSRMARLNDGLRYTDSGKQKYWLPNSKTNPSIGNPLPHLKTPLLQKKSRANSITSSHASIRGLYPNSILTVDSKNEDELIQHQQTQQSIYNYNTIEEEADDNDRDFDQDEQIFADAKANCPYGDKNYPVIYDTEAYTYSPALQRLREEAMARQSIDSNRSF
ncbi:putative membrane protein [Wickerhamomyces ciferrii]|uniref:Membrane protein n=1 Tax=Wickerhamomyces ciferrii (strain ATCC 14091 / BCRC 22168 / CBS 111 / JCM 3599 / NBRC 0793 / NRRL Y-1031 F-60-10) TaxID=1206466 RepID=K0KNV3_WICCF|nr:uncharacterized protein BN7_2631 [Wickerhamomyces ciferrii]CCH43084.1 putative membrane protein [Wickerhamomyces ciferrii]